MIIEIIGWKEGLPKIEFNRWLRAYSGLSIAEAKICVDEILANKPKKIHIQNLSESEAECALTEMKLIYEILKSSIDAKGTK